MLQQAKGLDAVALAGDLEGGRISTADLIGRTLAAVKAREPVLGAFCHVADDLTRAAAVLDAGTPFGPLHGLPVAVKDIFDTSDMPTSYGSRIYAGHRPRSDAACVARLKAAGAVLIGKTVTAEFGHVTLGDTRNPHDSGHSAGGSSSGSAAAVGAGLVPLAIGTQTGGSTIRPAAYCGAVGFKPSYGLLPMAGVKPLSPTLDTVGLFAGSIAGAELLFEALSGGMEGLACERPSAPPSRFALCRTAAWNDAEPAARAAVELAAAQFTTAGAVAVDIDLDSICSEALALQLDIANYELSRSLAWEYSHHAQALSIALCLAIENGHQISTRQYMAARDRASALRQQASQAMAGVAVVLTPAAPGEAPGDPKSIGKATFNSAWTLLGLPCITLPVGLGPGKLPIGVQLVGAWHADAKLIQAAQWLEGDLSQAVLRAGLPASRGLPQPDPRA